MRMDLRDIFGSPDPNLSEEERLEVFTSQVYLIYQQSRTALGAVLISASVLIYALWNYLSLASIVVWLSVMALVTILRMINVGLFFRNLPSGEKIRIWSRRFCLTTIFSALAWSSAGIFLMPSGSIPLQMFTLLILGGVSAGTIATYSAMKWNVTVFSTIVLIPVAIRFSAMGTQFHLTVAILTVLFWAVIVLSAGRVHNSVVQSLRLKLLNVGLIAKLEEDKIWVEQLNQDLKEEIVVREKAETEKEKLIADLQNALVDIKKLGGMIPICSSCKKIRDDQGFWQQVEEFIENHSEAVFSHSICPECREKLYPGVG